VFNNWQVTASAILLITRSFLVWFSYNLVPTETKGCSIEWFKPEIHTVLWWATVSIHWNLFDKWWLTLYSYIDVPCYFCSWLLHCWEVARVLENVTKWSLGVLMYARKAEPFHLPIFQIIESSMPAWAADVAAPIWELWPVKAWRACLVLEVNTNLVRGCPFLKQKNGPGLVPLAVMYFEDWQLRGIRNIQFS